MPGKYTSTWNCTVSRSTGQLCLQNFTSYISSNKIHGDNFTIHSNLLFFIDQTKHP